MEVLRLLPGTALSRSRCLAGSRWEHKVLVVGNTRYPSWRLRHGADSCQAALHDRRGPARSRDQRGGREPRDPLWRQRQEEQRFPPSMGLPCEPWGVPGAEPAAMGTVGVTAGAVPGLSWQGMCQLSPVLPLAARGTSLRADFARRGPSRCLPVRCPGPSACLCVISLQTLIRRRKEKWRRFIRL